MKSKRYEYTPSYEDTVAIAENRGSGFDPLYKDVKMFKPRQGSNLIRILPPTWEGARHYGLPIKYHRNIGPKDRRYLCLRENDSSPYNKCPICQQLYKLGSRATQEDKEHLRVYDGVVYYIVDRDNEKEGVQLWSVTLKMNSQIAAQTIDVRRGSMVDIVNPDDGYDLEFTRRGERLKTDYLGYRIMREPSPLCDSEKTQDRWLEEVYDKPLPSVLNFFSPAYLTEVLFGGSSSEDADEDDRPRSRRRADDDSDPSAGRLERRGARSDDGDDEERAEDERPARSRREAARADDGDDAEVISRSAARRREADVDDGDGGDEPPIRRRERTRLEKEIDDEIPFDTKSNGSDDDKPIRARRPRRGESDDDGDEERPVRQRRGAVVDDEDPELTKAVREVSPDTRQRLRERLDRG